MRVSFYYDYGSPYAYIAWTQLPGMCEHFGAEIDYHPVLLGGLFKIFGNTAPADVAPKRKWLFEDIQRYADRYQQPFLENPHFILNTLPLMRGALWAADEGRLEDYNEVMFDACWARGRNMNDPAEIMAVLDEGGFDAKTVAAATQTDVIKQRLKDVTQEAADQGIFGVPTMIAGDQRHFGQDRLVWIEEILREHQPAE